ncbi:MAG: hypothetical protein ACK4UO_05345 [Pseudolabrys sp.]
MSIVLFILGGLAFAAGILLAAFGLPVSEFSFGNTLIISGATVATGGLILIGLGAVVSKLRQIADTLGTQLPAGTLRPMEAFEAAAPSRAAPAAGRVPFPPRPKLEPVPREAPASQPAPSLEADLPADIEAMPAPALRNPDVPPVTAAEEASLSPLSPSEAAPAPVVPPVEPPVEPRQEPTLDTGWRPPEAPVREPRGYFDSVWPAESKTPKESAAGPAESPQREPASSEPAPAEEPERPAVAVLKSGVVDGMAYTLYVDGSIDAELPQGTLHFSSIDELRNHIEKNA